MPNLVMTDKERREFISRKVNPKSNFRFVVFNLQDLRQFFGNRLSIRLQNIFGGCRLHPVDIDVRAKIPVLGGKGEHQNLSKLENNKSRRGRWIDIGKGHLEEFFGEEAARLILQHFTDICFYIPAGSLRKKIQKNWQIETVQTMLREGKSKKEIACTFGKSPSWVSWYIKIREIAFFEDDGPSYD